MLSITSYHATNIVDHILEPNLLVWGRKDTKVKNGIRRYKKTVHLLVAFMLVEAMVLFFIASVILASISI